MLPRSRTNTLTAATRNDTPSVNTYCTTAMTGTRTRNGEIRWSYSNMMPASGSNPKANPTTPAVVAATGRTSFGNWICLISFSWLTTELDASPTLVVNHFHGRIADSTKSG